MRTEQRGNTTSNTLGNVSDVKRLLLCKKLNNGGMNEEYKASSSAGLTLLHILNQATESLKLF